MTVVIKTIPHNQQPYDTGGDWRFENSKGEPISQMEAHARSGTDDCVLRINVSQLGDYRYEMLVAIHELCETLMCMHDGVQIEDVDVFDKAFEAAREPGSVDEPGDDPKAPYVKQHCFATAIERMMCAAIGCTWREYEARVNALPTTPTKE